MQEAAENTYRILDFDPAIVNRMIDFMYCGDYESEETDSNDVLFHSLLANVKAKDSLDANVAMNSTVASLFIHLEMNSIADFYDVYQLRETALDRIRNILAKSWKQVVNWYPAFLEATCKKTTDTNLHSLLVEISMSHCNELDGLVYGCGVDLDVPSSYFSALLGKMNKYVSSLGSNLHSGPSWVTRPMSNGTPGHLNRW